jgi:Uma2 family endonuclease
MTVAIHTPLRMSLEEFLDWPGDGMAKHYQLIDGEVRPMSPASATHSRIQLKIGILLDRCISLAQPPLWALTEAAIVPAIRPTTNLRVADLVVTRAPDAAGQIAIPEVILAVEILSPGNERERREAIRAYTTVASMQEILVVRSTRVAAEILRRQADGHWPRVPEEVGPGGTVRLDSVGLTCPIEEFYAGTHLVP